MDVKKDISGGDLELIENVHSSLVVTHGSNIQAVISSIVKHFSSQGYNGVYLSLNKPHSTVESILKRHGVSPGRMYYIDCITASIHSVDDDDSGSVFYLDHFDDLSQKSRILEAVEGFALSVPDKKFFILDALRTILLYHEPELVSDLIKDLIKEFQDINIKFIVLTRSGDEREVIDMISYHFDQVLDI